MTTSAHASRHVYSGATRTPARPPSVTSTFFDELHPHLRNVEAIVIQGADLMYQYLLKRGPRTTNQIAEKVGLKKDVVARRLNGDPRFRREKQGWVAVPPEPETEPPPPPPTAGERIRAYLKQHGDATTQDIAEALGILPGTVATALSNGCGAQRVGTRRQPGVRPANLWGIR